MIFNLEGALVIFFIFFGHHISAEGNPHTEADAAGRGSFLMSNGVWSHAERMFSQPQ